ncbi:hypothetical protein GKZ68_06050 [Hymenobacter sp. BRD128]|uniref:hypothetical protein n=1 Tax=Hymenobacter sp. BRD128 TaxID=2675878 RepID=UPI00156632A9|nr:hypothetical protein [Hymenobacter sp. BRD128]QKG55161.1 hypothetical protein GKZ68_06050 [Hymenobacter sp. BRD128]
MSVTRLKRKHRKNIARANNETRKIKNLLRTPVLKNVDLDELKARFTTSAPAEADEKKNPSVAAEAAKPAAKQEGLLAKVAHAASAAADTVKHAASEAIDAVSHNSLVEKATGAVQEAAHNVVEGAKHVLDSKSPEHNQATEANQTGTTGFDAAEAETKPVTEDGQAGEHPKPEIAL